MKLLGKLCISLLSVLMVVGFIPVNDVNAAVKLSATSKTIYVGSGYTLKLKGTSKKGHAKSSSSAVKVSAVKKTKKVKVRKRVTVKVKVRGKWKKKKVWRKVTVKKKVTVKNSFYLAGKRAGSADVSVTYGKKKIDCHVTVYQPQLNTVVGYTYKLASRLSHTSNSRYWTSNQAVALVDEYSGLLMPIHSGSCIIYRKVNNKVKSQIKINVKSSGDVKVGVDVSRHNGIVNFNTLKKNNINFAIIRGGNGCHKYGTTDNNSIDLNLKRNIEGAKAAGMEIGLYWYLNSSRSKRLMLDDDAKLQGERFASRLSSLDIEKNTPIYIDLEERSALVKSGSKNTKAEFQKEMCQIFEAKLREKGFKNIGIYASTSWYKDYLKNDYFMNKVDVGEEGITSHWLAHYNYASKEGAQTPQFYYNGRLITPDIWQTGSRFRISGTGSTYVDMNYLYQ
jgi:GH25 family lysozyme M1 (1,4-beta-N-acetylmuramidase)